MPPQTDELAPYEVPADLAKYAAKKNGTSSSDEVIYDPNAPAKVDWSQYEEKPGATDWSQYEVKPKTKPSGDEVIYDPEGGPWQDYQPQRAPESEKGPWNDYKSDALDDPDLKTGKGMLERSQARQQLQRPLDNAVAPGQRAIGERPTLASRAAEVTLGDPHPLRRFMHRRRVDCLLKFRQQANLLCRT